MTYTQAVRRLVTILVLCLLIVPGARSGEFEVVLKNGQSIMGQDLQRAGGSYLIYLDTGEVLTVPAELVEAVRLSGQRTPDPNPPGLLHPEPQVLAGDAGALAKNPGIVEAEPQVLKGSSSPEAVRPVTPSEATAVFGEPARFQQGIFDPQWHPTTDWNMDPVSQNNFAPSTWAENVIDPEWEPESAFDYEDVMAASESTFQAGVSDPTWHPTDGFAK